MIKHENSSSKSSKASKSNSAPNSPNLKSKSVHNINANPYREEKSIMKLRSSISSSNMNGPDDKNRKQIKKKLAFSDDEIINDIPQSNGSNNRNSKKNENYERSDRLNNSYNTRSSQHYQQEQYHKRSSSLTKSSVKQYSSDLKSARGRNGSTNLIYDYKSIYDAFEKPIDDVTAASKRSSNNIDSIMRSSVYGTNCVSSINNNNNNSTSNYMTNSLNSSSNKMKYTDHTDLFKKAPSQISNLSYGKDNYLDKDKIAAAASAAAEAVAAAASSSSDLNNIFQRDNKERDYMNIGTCSISSSNGGGVLNYMQSSNNSSNSNTNKNISDFYNITKSQLDSLSVS
jgi:hypothetical protein